MCAGLRGATTHAGTESTSHDFGRRLDAIAYGCNDIQSRWTVRVYLSVFVYVYLSLRVAVASIQTFDRYYQSTMMTTLAEKNTPSSNSCILTYVKNVAQSGL